VLSLTYSLPTTINIFKEEPNCHLLQPVASIAIPGGRSLHPVNNKGEESFDKVADQNFPPIFSGQTTPFTKLLPYFFYFPLFLFCFLRHYDSAET